jgi:hypothetical protein
MLKARRKNIKIAALAALFLLCTVTIFPQNDFAQRGSIPEELLRPRKGEAPRYPIDMVIGSLGRGQAPQEAYDIAKSAAAAFLAGNMDASVFSPVNKVFVESCMSMLNAINPQFYRLGSGREEPDGSVSFLVRFVGREQGITGELFIRLEERRPAPPPPPDSQPAEPQPAAIETDAASEAQPESADGENVPVEQVAQPEPPPPPPVQDIPVQKIWLFEDLILEEARSREQENKEDRHLFDFSPYERIY